MRLISVVMGVDNPDNRTSDTVKLLNYGFNSYKLSTIYEKGKYIEEIKVENGKLEKVNIGLVSDATELLNVNEKQKKYTLKIDLKEIKAPVKKGDIIAKAKIVDENDKVVNVVGITVLEDVLKANLWDYFMRNIKVLVLGKTL